MISCSQPARQRVAVLDGVRGLAILLVLMYHGFGVFTIQTRPEALFKLGFASYGWMGVDLFFVLSGFLITGILLDTKNSPKYFQAFYMRRILRIFPLYYFVVLSFFFILPRFSVWGAGAFQIGLSELPWFLSYLMNYHDNITVPLGHFWSLCIEEQFYLLWPFMVWKSSRRTLACICVVIILGSPILRWLFCIGGVDPHALSAYSIARADALLFGAFLAVTLRSRAGLVRYRYLALICAVSSGIIVAVMYFLDALHLTPITLRVIVGLTMIDFFFASFLAVIVTTPETELWARFFKGRLLCRLGTYSYGIYVFNWPVVVFFAQYFGGEEHVMPIVFGSQIPFVIFFGIFVSVLSYGLAFLSYHLMEEHFLSLKRFFKARQTIPGAAI